MVGNPSETPHATIERLVDYTAVPSTADDSPSSHIDLGAQISPTLSATPTSQPAPPMLIYPPDGAVLTESITVENLEYVSTGLITYVVVIGEDFTARACAALSGRCMPFDFENESTLLPDGHYTWSVLTVKPLGSSASERWSFQVDTESLTTPTTR